jgi:hypothetical protein
MGIVKDLSGPIGLVNVYLTLREDSTGIIAGAVTDNRGKFRTNLVRSSNIRDY